MGTAKQLMVLVAMMAMGMAVAVPAFAQGQQEGQYADEGQPGPSIVTATGVLGEPYTPSQDPTPVYDLTDEATGKTYRLFDISAGLDAFVGQRVTVEGTRSPGIDPLSLDVTSVAPAGASDEEITATFELTVEGEPPAGTQFFGGASQQTAELTDPDGDGTYTGSLTLPEGFYDLGAFEVPVAILAGSPEIPNQQTIKYFGEMVLEDGDAFSASVSYDDGTEPPATTDPEEPTDECLALSPTPEECEGYVAPGGSGSGGIAVVSGDTSDANKGGSGSVDGNDSVVASAGSVAKNRTSSVAQGGSSPIASVLPATGGILPLAGAAGALLIVGGIVARRVFR